MRNYHCTWAALFLLFSCQTKPHYDTIIQNGMLYDGTGHTPYKGDIAISGDTIASIGDLSGAEATSYLDAKGMAVSPGFIDMQSQSMVSLLQDGRSMSAIRQGVTLEIFGEGSSEGPNTDSMKAMEQRNQGDIRYKVG